MLLIRAGGQKFIDLEWNAQTYRDMHSFVGQYSSLYLKYCKLNMITKRYIDENIENKDVGHPCPKYRF